jgi:hypothetical protein
VAASDTPSYAAPPTASTADGGDVEMGVLRDLHAEAEAPQPAGRAQAQSES